MFRFRYFFVVFGGATLMLFYQNFSTTSSVQTSQVASLKNLRVDLSALDTLYADDQLFQKMKMNVLSQADRYLEESNGFYSHTSLNSQTAPSPDGLVEANECQSLVISSQFAYGFTGLKKYRERIKNELLYIVDNYRESLRHRDAATLAKMQPYYDTTGNRFNWSPSRKELSYGGMSTCFGLGYLWTKSLMSRPERKRLLQYFVDSGLTPAVKEIGWFKEEPNKILNKTNGKTRDLTVNGIEQALKTNEIKINLNRIRSNWTAWYLGGVQIGALIVENDPDAPRELKALVSRINTEFDLYFPLMVDALGVDGVYTESPQYQNVTTTYTSLFLMVYNDMRGEDYKGYLAHPNLLGLANFSTYMLGADYRNYWRYGDGPSNIPLNFASFMGHAHNISELSAAANKNALALLAANQFENNHSPFRLLWYQPTTDSAFINKPLAKAFTSSYGAFSSARTSWTDPDSIVLMAKGGNPSDSHGMMDIGSFMIQAGGVTWVDRLGPESYSLNCSGQTKATSLEPTSGLVPKNKCMRWSYLRNNSRGHSVLTVDGRLQNFDKFGFIRAHRDDQAYVSYNLTPMYKPTLTHMWRNFSINEDKSVRILDGFKTVGDRNIKWAAVICNKKVELDSMSTTATVESNNGRKASFELINNSSESQDGRFTLETLDAEDPSNRLQSIEKEAVNSNCQRLAVNIFAQNQKERKIRVDFKLLR